MRICHIAVHYILFNSMHFGNDFNTSFLSRCFCADENGYQLGSYTVGRWSQENVDNMNCSMYYHKYGIIMKTL